MFYTNLCFVSVMSGTGSPYPTTTTVSPSPTSLTVGVLARKADACRDVRARSSEPFTENPAWIRTRTFRAQTTCYPLGRDGGVEQVANRRSHKDCHLCLSSEIRARDRVGPKTCFLSFHQERSNTAFTLAKIDPHKLLFANNLFLMNAFPRFFYPKFASSVLKQPRSQLPSSNETSKTLRMTKSFTANASADFIYQTQF